MTANCSARIVFSSIALALCAVSHAAPARWPDACANALTRALPGWRHAVPPPDALPWVDERITRDGILVPCFEKAGVTYLYERGSWRFIVDSD